MISTSHGNKDIVIVGPVDADGCLTVLISTKPSNFSTKPIRKRSLEFFNQLIESLLFWQQASIMFTKITEMKKFSWQFLFVLIAYNQLRSQDVKKEADQVLQKEIGLLQKIKDISYAQTRETNYYGENYHNLFQSSLYFDFRESNNPVGFRFQGNSDDYSVVFNGDHSLGINKEKQTIASTLVPTAADIQNSSYLYHSIAMLQNFIPAVLANDSVLRSVSDTMIGKQRYYNVRVNCPERMYFQIFRGTLYMDKPGAYMQYHLIIDQKTWLPFIFLQKYIRSATDDRDFVMTTYSDVNMHPTAPVESSWKYETYTAQYKPYVPPVKRTVVKIGDSISNFSLPAISTSGVTTVNYNAYAGKIVLIDFWFRACGPCMEAMPKYNSLQSSFPKDRFSLVTINVTDNEQEVRFFYNKFKPLYPMLINGAKIFEKIGFSGCPSSVLIDQNGKVVKTFSGYNDDEIRKSINDLLNTKG